MFNCSKNSYKDSQSSVNELRRSIQYLINQANINGEYVDKFHTLMYLQKTICNSIIYNDYGYKTLHKPHSAPQMRSVFFIPKNENYRYFNLKDNPIYLELKDVAFITWPWSNKGIIDDIRGIGKDANNPFNAKDPHIDNLYIYPLGIVLVSSSGNHSQFVGLLKGEISKLKVNEIYDISEELIKDSDGQFANFYGSSKKNDFIEKWQSIMEIGKYLFKYNEFTSPIMNYIDSAGVEKISNDHCSKLDLDSMSYKTRVGIECSNTGYQRITGDLNLNHVPQEIQDMWSDSNREYSIVSLTNKNADDSEWKILYEMFQKEFAKLK